MRYSLLAMAGLIIGWIVYSSSSVSTDESKDISDIEFQPDMQKVVFSYQPEKVAYLKLPKTDLNKRLKWRKTKRALELYLKLSIQFNSMRYAGVGLQLYQRSQSTIRNHPQVMLAYSDLLTHIDDIDSATLVLNDIKKNILDQPRYVNAWQISPNEIAEQVNLRLFTHFLARGELSSANETCQDLQSTKTATIAQICRAWVNGLNGNPDQSIATLEKLVSSLREDDRLKAWTAEALIDLYLFAGNSIKAIAAYNYLVNNDASNLSIASQIVDFLILNDNNDLALSVLNTQPGTDSLIIRRVIVEQRLGKSSELKQRAQALIELYEFTDDPNRYYDIALWYSTSANQQKTALRYANLHLNRSKSFHDKALLRTIDNAIGNTAS